MSQDKQQAAPAVERPSGVQASLAPAHILDARSESEASGISVGQTYPEFRDDLAYGDPIRSTNDASQFIPLEPGMEYRWGAHGPSNDPLKMDQVRRNIQRGYGLARDASGKTITRGDTILLKRKRELASEGVKKVVEQSLRVSKRYHEKRASDLEKMGFDPDMVITRERRETSA